MKKIFLLVLLLIYTVIFSQEKKYTTYRVTDNETLSSIARKLGVTSYELEKLNPDAKNGINIDEVLIVPNPKFKGNTSISKTSNSVTFEKDSIKNGILYHKVKFGETIYSLSKKFKIKKKKLLKFNQLKKRSKIKIGQILKIPTNKKDTCPPKKPTEVVQVVTTSDFIPYEVKAGETKYTLAKRNNISIEKLEEINPKLKSASLKEYDVILLPKLLSSDETNVTTETENQKLYTITKEDSFYNFEHKYGYTKDELITLNPQLSEGLKLGMQIKLPSKNNTETVKESYKIHTVAAQETFYKLKTLYGVSEADLLAINPELKNGLKEGMQIKIPVKETIVNKNVMLEGNISGKELNLVMLLPFKTNVKTDFSDNSKHTSFINKVTDFYLGSLMALDSLKNKGLSVNIKVFDTKNSKAELDKIIKTYDFSKTDVVIGPLVYSRFKQFSNAVAEANFPIISPISKKDHTTILKANVVQDTPTKKVIKETMLQFILDNYTNQNLVLIADEGKEIEAELHNVEAFLQKHDSINKMEVLRMEKGQIKQEEFEKVLKKDVENWAILVTDTKKSSTTFVALNSLKIFPDEFKISLFALDKGDNFNFEKEQNYNLNRLNIHFPDVLFMDASNSKISQFNKKYKNKYGSKPSEFSYKGFDTTYDALVRLANFNTITDAFQTGNSYRLCSNFVYLPKQNSGFLNSGVHILALKNYKLVELNHFTNREVENNKK